MEEWKKLKRYKKHKTLNYGQGSELMINSTSTKEINIVEETPRNALS
jgi:hypothetical protein